MLATVNTTQNAQGTNQKEAKVLKVLTIAQSLGFEIAGRFDGNNQSTYDLSFEGIRYRLTFGKEKGLWVNTYAKDVNGWNWTSARTHHVSSTKAGFASDMVKIHADNKIHGINA